MTAKIETKPGARFGRLRILHELEGTSRRTFLLKCDCGRKHKSLLYRLRNGGTWQCSRCARAQQGRSVTKHGRDAKDGLHNRPGYKNWRSMMRRCYDEGHPGYPNYGGRGIRVCRAWREDFRVFQLWFLGQPGNVVRGIQVNRVEDALVYGPDTCNLLTRKENMRERRHHVWVTYRGCKMPLSQCHELCGSPVHYNTALNRYTSGWSLRRAMMEPARSWRHAEARIPSKVTKTNRTRAGRNRMVEYRGKLWIFTDLWERHGTSSYTTARARLRMGWSTEEVLRGRSVRRAA